MKEVSTMSNEGNSREIVDPMELWEKWYETAMQQWFETMSDILEKSSVWSADPFGLSAQWLEMMEEARARIMADANIPVEPYTLMKQWYDAAYESSATIIGEIIEIEKCLESAGQFLESYASLYRTFRRANEEFFSNLQFPTRSDIARVSELVIEVKNKVESIEVALQSFEDSYTRAIPDNLKERLEQVEKKIDALPGTFQKLTIVDGLEKRLDGVENKLDKLLVALEEIKVKELQKSSRSPNPNSNKVQAARRVSSKG
jgi:hypothetical protein